jgi:DNA-binding transcriptional ArsR family regulator
MCSVIAYLAFLNLCFDRNTYMNNISYVIFIIPNWWTKTKKGLTTICYRFFTNLANPTRLAILEQLIQKPQSVNELSTKLGQEQSMISHNIKPLLDCNIITSLQQGKKHILTVNQETILPIFQAIENHAQKFCPTGGKCLKEE